MAEIIIIYVVTILLLFLALFILNGCETAVTAITPIKLRLFFNKDLNSRRIKTIVKLVKNFNVTLVTILCGQTIASTGWATIATLMIVKLTHNRDWIVSLTIILLTIFVLIFADTLPKLLAQKHPSRYICSFYWFILGLTYLLFPFVKLLSLIGWKKEFFIREHEIINMINSLNDHPAIDKEERKLVVSAFNFDEKNLKQVITPFPKVKKITTNALNLKQIFYLFLRHKYSRIPVFDLAKSRFIGVIKLNSVLGYLVKKNDYQNQKMPILRKIMLPIINLSGDIKLNHALKQMRTSQIHLAGVVDERSGQTIGIVTLEDILEEIVGEIYDEKDVNMQFRSLSDSEWRVELTTKVVIFFNEQLNIKINSEWEHWNMGEWFNYFWQKQGAKHSKKIRYKNFIFILKVAIDSRSQLDQKFIFVKQINLK